MCCWPITKVILEDPPPKKPKEEEKPNYVLVSDQLNLQPVVSQHLFLPSSNPSTPPYILDPSRHLLCAISKQIVTIYLSKNQTQDGLQHEFQFEPPMALSLWWGETTTTSSCTSTSSRSSAAYTNHTFRHDPRGL